VALGRRMNVVRKLEPIVQAILTMIILP
jgi:hypothetical protein